MPEQYDSIHTGEVIDSAVQTLFDFGITQESNNLYLACIDGAGITINPQCNVSYNIFRYTLLDNVCFMTLHIKANISNPGNGYAVIKGLPYTSLYDTGLSVYEVCGEGFKHDDGNSIIPPVTLNIQSGKNYVRIEDNSGMVATRWSTGDFWIGASGFYFIQN